MRIKKEQILLIGILAMAIVLRVWRLDLNPVGLVHDEIHQIVSAKSIALTGEEAAGTGAGIFNNSPSCDGNCVFGELPSYLLVPFSFLNLPFPWVKLPLILMSILIVYFGGKLFENLTSNKKIGLIVSLVIALNPWAINFGRSAYENLFTFGFYLWSLCLLTQNPIKLKNQIWGIVLGLAASMSYFGAKPIFVPLMLIGLLYGYVKEKKSIGKYISLALVSIILMVGYMFILKNSFAGLRINETKLMSQEIIDEVNYQRKNSLDIPVVRDIFINKYTVLGKSLLKKYFAVLAPNYLFNEGEMGYDHFMIEGHSFMYLVDLPLVLLGFYYLSRKKGKELLFLIAIILTLPIVPMVSNYATTYALRCGLLYPVLAGFSGVGIYGLGEISQKFKYKNILWWGILGIYAASVVNFEVMYWYRNPFEKSAGWVFYERELVKYLELTKEKFPDKKIMVVSGDPVDVLYEYALFSRKMNNKDFMVKMNETIRNKEYLIDEIKVSKDCPKLIDKETVYLFAAAKDCVKEPNTLARIAEVRDAGTRWAIPNEFLCKDIKLERYPYPREIEDFKIEKMERKTFCQKWITQPI